VQPRSSNGAIRRRDASRINGKLHHGLMIISPPPSLLEHRGSRAGNIDLGQKMPRALS